MPSTYPRMKDKSYPNHPQIPHPPQTPNTHTPTTPSTPSSRFLSPIQESRIQSWRAHVDPEDLGKGSKSAPATLDHDPSCAASGSSQNSREKTSSAGQSLSRCSCSSSPHQHHTHSGRPPPPSRHTVTNTNPTTPVQRGKGHKQPHQMRSYYSNKKKTTTASSTPTPQILSPPMPRGTIPSGSPFPSQAQHGYDTAPMGYDQTAPQIPPPITQMQPPPPRPDPPRIAGARDPISQN
jgi:hypothetical protein